MWNASDFLIFSLVIFGVTCLGLGILVYFGHQANKKSHFADHLETVISERRLLKMEDEARKKQEQGQGSI